MSRGLALLFGAGATLVVLTLLLPHRGPEAQTGLLIPAGLAYVVVALLLAAPARFSPGALSVNLALGSTLIAVCVGFGGPAGGVYAFMYVWVALYAAAFFSVRMTVAQVAWAAASYAIVLVAPGDVRPPAAAWLMAAGTSAVAAALILGLVRELRARATDLATVTSLANQIGSASEVSADAVAARVCEGVRVSTRAGAVILLEETAEGDGLHAVGEAGSREQAAPFEQPEGILVVDEAYGSGEARELLGAGGVHGIAQPVRRKGRVAGLLIVVWERPLRRVSTRIRESVALFAAEAGVGLERIAHQNRDRERRALELNDEIVQGLVVAMYALRDGRVEMGEQAVDETLDRARALVESQLQDLHGAQAPEPGSLRVRRRPDG
ncbi:MAG: hypothetical protein JWM73_2208 [Solirubrobacterales bacterium]|nr:hypothetical protein [Solirubrobacterales bacterium]